MPAWQTLFPDSVPSLRWQLGDAQTPRTSVRADEEQPEQEPCGSPGLPHGAPGKVWGGSDAEPVAVVKEPCQPWEEVVFYREGTAGCARRVGGRGAAAHGWTQEPGGAGGCLCRVGVLAGGDGPSLSGSSCDNLCSVLFWHNAGLYKS